MLAMTFTLYFVLLAWAVRAYADFTWGSIGDSWASGVAYNASNVYDGFGTCLRTTEAYSAQLLGQSGWTTDKQNGLFKACSGAQLVDMASRGSGQNQIEQLNNDPSLVIMTAGGNNAGFYNIAVNCIYQLGGIRPNSSDFNCAQALSAASEYVNRPPEDANSFLLDLTATYKDLFTSIPANNSIKAGRDFYLYQTGYAHPFNIDDDGNWCNNVSFALSPVQEDPPLLTQSLRASINQLTTDVNSVIAEALRSFVPPDPQQHIGYVDISAGFDGHRFCEGAHRPQANNFLCSGKNGQYNLDDVWLWNVSPSFVPPRTVCPSSPGEAPPPNYVPDGPLFNWSQDDTVSPASIGWIGSSSRPFHPKWDGHHSIASSIVAQLRKDGVRGIAGSAPALASPASPSVPAPASPANPPAPSASDICGTWYKFIEDSFQIYGKNFEASKLGFDGLGLLSDLRQCGAVTDWQFSNLTNDPQGMQWQATGNMPIGVKSCVGSAVLSAGGSSKDGCTGAG